MSSTSAKQQPSLPTDVQDRARANTSVTLLGIDLPTSDSPRERVADDIIRGLYEGRYQPGQRLVEGKLTEYYGTSRGPVREALSRLAAMGLVHLTPQRGGHVRRLTLDDAIDILIVVQALMQTAGRLAATRIPLPRAVDQFTAALQHLDSFDGSSHSLEYAIARDRFYSVITMLAGNAELQRIMPSVQTHLIRVQFGKLTQKLDRRRHVGYRRIAEAILSGQPARAEEAIRKQFGRTIQYLQAIREQGGIAATDRYQQSCIASSS